MGSWILEALAAANGRGLGLSATVLTRDPEAFASRIPHLAGHSWLRLLRGDVRTFTAPQERYDAVLHAAFDSSRLVADGETRETILEGTRRCLELARTARARKFLFVSSGAVYGTQPPEVSHVVEDRADDPALASSRSAYGEAKFEAERWVVGAGREFGFDAAIARGFAFAGPRLPLDAHFAVGNFLGDALTGRPIRVRGDGTAVRSYLYAPELAVWLLAILLRGASGRAYNVGSEESVSMAELARRVAAAVAPGLAVEIASAPSGREPDRYVPDTRRARVGLGLSQTIGLDEALTRTAAWHRRF